MPNARKCCLSKLRPQSSLCSSSCLNSNAILLSVLTATFATIIALLLGSLAAAAIARYSFFGRDVISLIFVLPIALPGIVTGIALNNVFTNFFGGLTFFTIIIGHATFCVVVVFNNVAARYRRMGSSFEEASMDLGANRITTFRLVTFPMIRNALVAGGLLSFGLSFDEIIVTTFTAGAGQTTLPIWIFQNLFRPNQAPIVNVVAAALIIVSIVPIYLSQRLTQERK
ncbi:MAG: ABC transporter permease subunit [Actinobacteria bacterium]|nr:ABC transporter permease subunit [Actinomycetota bacterium]